jgi:formylglycine-generating enzyme required for sulfatase activity
MNKKLTITVFMFSVGIFLSLVVMVQPRTVAQSDATAQAEVVATAVQERLEQTAAAREIINVTQTAVVEATAMEADIQDALEQVVLEQAKSDTLSLNSDWVPFEKDFDGVTMVLVPAGCFEMGVNDAQATQVLNEIANVLPDIWQAGMNEFERWFASHEVCFNSPFWIDKYEVTQAQFTQFGGAKEIENLFTGIDRPVDSISWHEAYDYCELRGASLPSEAQWEYAARGVESWIYPWGNQFVSDNVVYAATSNNETAIVGSRPEGASWIGAMDMSGNVWEWVNSIYALYPYTTEDGRERHSNFAFRVFRGGSVLIPQDIIVTLRSSFRIRSMPNQTYDDIGFRCVRSVD